MTAWKPKKILVTGCAGFIGSNFLKMLLKDDLVEHVTHLDALTYAGNLETIKDVLDHPKHKFVKGDIRDTALCEKLIADVDSIVNFAAETHVDRSIDGPRAFIETNVNGTFNLLEAARKKKDIRFLQISTDEVYGSLGDTGAFTEETPLAPNSPYSAAKASADMLVRSYHHTFGLDTITTRCSNNYGPFQFPEKLIPVIVLNAQNDTPLPVYGNGMNVRDWIHVSDHSKGVWAALTRGKAGEVYNLGSDNEWTNIDIVKLILKHLKKPESLIKYVKDRPGHDLRYAIDAKKSKSELGWAAQVKFESGISETIDWYINNQAWLKSVQSGDYRSFFDRWYKER